MQSTTTLRGNVVMPLMLAATALVCLLVGWLCDSWAVSSAAATAAVCYVAVRAASRRSAQASDAVAAVRKSPSAAPVRPRRDASKPGRDAKPTTPTDQCDTAQLVEQMLEDGRFALLLRPQLIRYLSAEQLRRAQAALDDGMGLVPEGEVLLRCWGDDGEQSDEAASGSRVLYVEAHYLDRYPVTNCQYQRFIEQGGYEQMSLWDQSVWPGILQFIDRTGYPGPRGWENGTPPAGQEDHPVVGVCWFEAQAYSRWCGKRLPSDAEWVKAACWPISATGTTPLQRRYPWGDTMDRSRANLWGSHGQRTSSVFDFADGGSVGGIQQLVGNVWEWTSSNFGIFDPRYGKLDVDTPMKSLRGGAFDTYFENQACCQFQSGDSPMARKHNIGFRCALGLCDLAPAADTLEINQQTAEELAVCP